MNRITGMVIAIVLLLSGCASVKTLPRDEMAYVKEFSLVKEVSDRGGKLTKVKFKNGIGKYPVAYLVLGNAEGEDSVEFRLYFKGKLLKDYTLTFGEKGKYYKEVVLWRLLEAKREGEYQLAIFHNGALLLIRKFIIRKEKKSQ